MKGVEWEVSLANPAFYYKERGGTPEEALRKLRDAVARGVADATEQVALQQRRLDGLSEYLAELTQEEGS